MSSSKILIPVDGSPASLRAVDFAIAMVGQNLGTSIVLLHVAHIPTVDLASLSEPIATDWLQETVAQASAKALKDSTGRCDGAGVAFKALTRTGQVAETIVRVAHSEDVKHIVMGTRGLGGIQGLLLGSVATQVIHLAEVPVTLIK